MTTFELIDTVCHSIYSNRTCPHTALEKDNDQNLLLDATLPTLSLEEFQTYWSEQHPQAAPEDAFSTLGVKRYVQVLPIETEARNLVIGPRTGLVEPFDGIAELWVDSIEALEGNWSTDKAKKYVEIFFKDEQNFIDWSRSTILVSNENIVMP